MIKRFSLRRSCRHSGRERAGEGCESTQAKCGGARPRATPWRKPAGSRFLPDSSFKNVDTGARKAAWIGGDAGPKTSGSITLPVVQRSFSATERPIPSTVSLRRAPDSSLLSALTPNNAMTARTHGIHAIRCRRISSFPINYRNFRERWENVNGSLGRISVVRSFLFYSHTSDAESCLLHHQNSFRSSDRYWIASSVSRDRALVVKPTAPLPHP